MSLLILKCVNLVLLGSLDPEGICLATAVIRNAAPSAKIEFVNTEDDSYLAAVSSLPKGMVTLMLGFEKRDQAKIAAIIRVLAEKNHGFAGMLCPAEDGSLAKAINAAGYINEYVLISPGKVKGRFQSSVEMFQLLFGDEVDEHTKELCQAAIGDRRSDFSAEVRSLADKLAVYEANPQVWIDFVSHYAFNREPCSSVLGWLKKKDLWSAHREVIAESEDRLGGIVRLDIRDREVDLDTLFLMFAELGYEVAVVERYAVKKGTAEKVKIATCAALNGRRDLNIGDILKEAGVKSYDLGGRASVLLSAANEAETAIRRALREQK